jgi:hypothetical protein
VTALVVEGIGVTEVVAVHTPEELGLDVVFIHGLDGDARKSWRRKDPSSFWPLWLADDVPGVAVWSVGYDGWSSNWRGRAMPMQDRAINLLAQLQNYGIGERPLCFVTHSMGGLLVKEMLLHAAEGHTDFASFATATKGVVFLGTPHTGSGLTRFVDALGILYRGSRAVEDLKRNSAHLRHLNDRYRDWVNDAGIRNLVFFETHPTKGVWVVDAASANPGLPGIRPIPVDSNHVDICKPANRSSVVYGQVKRFIAGIQHPVAAHPRILDRDRESLQPKSVPGAVSRASLLTSAINQRDRHAHTAGRRQILALVGEGGIGKSVLLGQYLDELKGRTDQAVVLVTCGNVSPDAELADLESVDKVLGAAAGPTRGHGGLLHLLAEQREAYGAVTLLIDTVDLVLSRDRAVGIAVFLVEALDIADVIMTCRTHEFTNYLRPIPRLTGRVTTFALPVLDEPEIIAWAKWYLKFGEQTADRSIFIESLSGGISVSGSLRQVCSLPVRLALACATFADWGHLPEDLSVTGLYQAYWDARVHAQGTIKEDAALEVARHVVDHSGRIALRVPKADVDASLRGGIESLVSEGVLREFATEWEFFHQTFAEFAHARWVLNHGVESWAVSELIERALSGSGNLWPVLASLLLQIRSFDNYQVAARLIPMTSADAVQTQTLGALQRDEAKALETVMTALAKQRDLLPVALAALGDAPAQHIQVALTAALNALRSPPRQVSQAIDALTRLVVREATNADLFQEALQAVSALTELAEDQREGYLERLVKPFTATRASDEKLTVLRMMYPELGARARRDAIRAHRLDGVPEKHVIAIARIALDCPCPPIDDGEQVDLLATLWRNPVERARLGWSSWRDVLAAPLRKGWDNAQIKFVVHLADLDNTLVDQMFDELMSGKSLSPESHVNAVAQIVAERTGWAAERLLSGRPPTADVALNALAKIAVNFAACLDHATLLQMIDWLRPVRPKNPRTVWPTQFVLAAGDLETHRLLCAQLRSANPEPAVLIGVVQSIFYHTPLRVLTPLANDLRGLVDEIRPRANSPATEKLRIRARLEGRLAESDTDSRGWIQQQIVEGTSPSVAGTVAKTIADTHPDGLPEPMTMWVGTLLRTPHTDAAVRLTELLLDIPALETGSLDILTRTAIDRMRAAVDNHEDSKLHRSLLGLVIKIDNVQPTDESDVRAVYRTVQSRLSRPEVAASDRSAALRDLATLSGTLMARHMDTGTVRDLIGDVLTSLGTARLGKKLVDKVASLLFSLLRRDPDAPAWLQSVFGDTGTALEIKLATAEAFLRYEGNMPGGYASALKDRSDCPPEVAALIVPRLQQT